MKKNSRELLDTAARMRVPDTINLYPRLAAQFERKTFMQTLRTKPALLLLTVLLSLAILTGATYAAGRILGYIPSLGIVEETASLRTLARPVSATRDGITLTVIDAVATSSQTVVAFSLENAPEDVFLHESMTGCFNQAELRLPDGTVLPSGEGEINSENDGQILRMRFVYPPIPVDINDVVFFLPCVLNSSSFQAPENWELSLQFISASAETTILPVTDLQTIPSASDSPFYLTQAIQVGEEIILIGAIEQPADNSWVNLHSIRVSDANGVEISSSLPTLEGLSGYEWGVQFQFAGPEYPVTLTFEGGTVAPVPGSTAEFTFDTGDSPQPGQVWTFDKPIEIGGRTVKLVSMFADQNNSLVFNFTGDSDVVGVSLSIQGFTPVGGGGGSGSTGFDNFSVSLAYAEMPSGQLRIVLSDLMIASPIQTWTLEWFPEDK